MEALAAVAVQARRGGIHGSFIGYALTAVHRRGLHVLERRNEREARAAVPLAVVETLGQPIVSTSANFSEQEVITEPWQLEDELGPHVDLIMEHGPLPVEASSVVSLIGDEATVLRAGKGDLSFFGAAH